MNSPTAHHVECIERSHVREFEAIFTAVIIQLVKLIDHRVAQSIKYFDESFEYLEMKGWRDHLSALVPLFTCFGLTYTHKIDFTKIACFEFQFN